MGHGVQAAPHAVTSVSAAHRAPQRCVAAGHTAWHAPAVQTAEPPAGTGQTTHAAPQAVASVSAAHLPGHAWNVALHVLLQTPSVHAVVALGKVGHAFAQPPQWLGLVSGSTHSAPHLTGALAAQPFVQWKVMPSGAQSGAVAPQAVLHAPQVAGFVRSISQPSAPLPLQSENPSSHLATAHLPFLHVIELWVVGQGVQEGSPQPWSGSVEETHDPAHLCCPVGHGGSPASTSGVGTPASGAGICGVPLSTSGTFGVSPGGGEVPASVLTTRMPGSLSRIVLQPTTASNRTLAAIVTCWMRITGRPLRA
jgi:hypothetical protein